MDKYKTTSYSVREVQVNYGPTKELKSFSTFRSPAFIADFIKSVMPNNSQEHVCAIYLDGAHVPIGWSIVFTGTANSCTIHPREVFQRACLLGSAAVVLAHNHPSGHPTPSAEDDSVTRKMKAAADVLAIKLLDHVIVAEFGVYSYFENGKL